MPRKPCGQIEKQIGIKIRKRREALGMTRKQLANAIGVSFQQIQKYEMGTNKISTSRLNDVTKHLKISPWEFFVVC